MPVSSNQSTTPSNAVLLSVRVDHQPYPHATTRIPLRETPPSCRTYVLAHDGVIFNLPVAPHRDHSRSKVVHNSLRRVDVTLCAPDAASSRSQLSNPSPRNPSTRLVSGFRCISQRVIARSYLSDASASRGVRRGGWFRRLSSALFVFQLCSASDSRASRRRRLRVRMGI